MIYTTVVGRAPAAGSDTPFEAVSLTWEERQRRVLRLVTSSGREVGIRLSNGGLKVGDVLGGEAGGKLPPLVVTAAPEPFMVIAPPTRQAFAAAAHFIGNRHIQAWISESEILVREDGALAKALAALGIEVRMETRQIDDETYIASGGGHTPHVHH